MSAAVKYTLGRIAIFVVVLALLLPVPLNFLVKAMIAAAGGHVWIPVFGVGHTPSVNVEDDGFLARGLGVISPLGGCCCLSRWLGRLGSWLGCLNRRLGRRCGRRSRTALCDEQGKDCQQGQHV